ncbi:hypothetical protein BS50DRAFT_577438 [Corynespora cassiicola Philippines]|uniref:Uncharacterized protein n=1 Tax=Corynespora cassiicola Philippines TaxID=1448308 RepID=A0A2T2NAT9_CORCC|nr:hypothetical protein BS50DRAFT_577438 [Corynespora cassiicola Philippines]
MTPRSPKQQPHPKSSTISRRLRNRADQSLSVQPAELPHLRGIRSHRAATLSSTNRHPSVNYPTEDTPTATTPWESLDSLDAFTRSSNTSHPQNPASGLLLSQPFHLPPYHSPQGSHSELVPISDPDPDIFKVQTTSGSDLLPSPLPSLSGSQTAGDFELRLSAEPNPSHDPSFELQDMRYSLAPLRTGNSIADLATARWVL